MNGFADENTLFSLLDKTLHLENDEYNEYDVAPVYTDAKYETWRTTLCRHRIAQCYSTQL